MFRDLKDFWNSLPWERQSLYLLAAGCFCYGLALLLIAIFTS